MLQFKTVPVSCAYISITRKIGLKFRGADLTMVDFVSNDETQTVFNQFMAERNIAADSAGSVAGH